MCVWSPGVPPVGQTCGVRITNGRRGQTAQLGAGRPSGSRAPDGAAHYNGASPRSGHTETVSQPLPIAFRPITQPGRRHRYVLLVAIILLVSAGVRLWHLSTPADYMFDEIYYAKDAKAIVDGRVTPKPPYRWEAGDEVSWPHPELGKMAIAAGIVLFGDRAFGWRVPAVVAGMVLLACVYPIARRLGLGPPWALLALLFAAADPLGMTQSRIATLDVFVAAWSVLCIYLALRYVQSERPLWLLFACGAAGGVALATKWSGVLALVAAALILLAGWLWMRRVGPAPVALREAAPEAAPDVPPPGSATPDVPRDVGTAAGSAPVPSLGAPPPRVQSLAQVPAGPRRARSRRVPAHLSRPDRGLAARHGRWPLTLAALALVPAVIYMLSYTQYFAAGHTLADWRELQRQMVEFNLHLKADAHLRLGGPDMDRGLPAGLVLLPRLQRDLPRRRRHRQSVPVVAGDRRPDRRAHPGADAAHDPAAARGRSRRRAVPAVVRDLAHLVPLLHDSRGTVHGDPRGRPPS